MEGFCDGYAELGSDYACGWWIPFLKLMDAKVVYTTDGSAITEGAVSEKKGGGDCIYP